VTRWLERHPQCRDPEQCRILPNHHICNSHLNHSIPRLAPWYPNLRVALLYLTLHSLHNLYPIYNLHPIHNLNPICNPHLNRPICRLVPRHPNLLKITLLYLALPYIHNPHLNRPIPMLVPQYPNLIRAISLYLTLISISLKTNISHSSCQWQQPNLGKPLGSLRTQRLRGISKCWDTSSSGTRWRY